MTTTAATALRERRTSRAMSGEALWLGVVPSPEFVESPVHPGAGRSGVESRHAEDGYT